MKDIDHMLTLYEVEELCRLHMDSKLSVLQENELRYLLSQSSYNSYNSPIIVDTRQSMLAENLLLMRILRDDKKKKRRFGPLRRITAVAASVIIIFSVVSVISNMGHKDKMYDETMIDYIASVQSHSSDGFIITAYEGGKQLSPSASVKAARESEKKAEELMAMAAAREQEEILKQERIMKLTSEKI